MYVYIRCSNIQTLLYQKFNGVSDVLFYIWETYILLYAIDIIFILEMGK